MPNYTNLQQRYCELLEDLRARIDLTHDEVHDLFGDIYHAGRIARSFRGLFADEAISSAFAEIAWVSDEYTRCPNGPAAYSTALLGKAQS